MTVSLLESDLAIKITLNLRKSMLFLIQLLNLLLIVCRLYFVAIFLWFIIKISFYNSYSFCLSRLSSIIENSNFRPVRDTRTHRAQKGSVGLDSGPYGLGTKKQRGWKIIRGASWSSLRPKWACRFRAKILIEFYNSIFFSNAKIFPCCLIDTQSLSPSWLHDDPLGFSYWLTSLEVIQTHCYPYWYCH